MLIVVSTNPEISIVYTIAKSIDTIQSFALIDAIRNFILIDAIRNSVLIDAITNSIMNGGITMLYEIRQVDAYAYDDGWTYNQTYHLDTFDTRANNLRKVFVYRLNKKGITFKKNRIIISYDGDCYEIIDKKTGEPLFVMYPIF